MYTFNPETGTLRKRGKEIIAEKNIKFAEGRIDGSTFIMKKEGVIDKPRVGLYVLYGEGDTPEVLGPIQHCWIIYEE